MIIPDSVLNKIEKKPIDNEKIYVAEEMYEDLMSRTKETYRYYQMAVLANTLELYYKGLLDASGLIVSEHLMKESHDLCALNSEISSRIQDINNCKSQGEERSLRSYLRELSGLYIDARYHNAQTSFEDFDKCRQYLTIQREKCMSLLDPSRSWDKPPIKYESNNLPCKDYKPSEDAINMLKDY